MTDVITPVGRIVWGNPLNGRPKTDNNNNPVMGQDGKPVTQWSFGLAIPKEQCGEIFAAMQAEAGAIFPQGTPQNFAWKFKDGDSLDDKGQPFSNREGYAGCNVFSISTEAFAPRVVRNVGNGYSDMTEGVKTGDYVRVALGVKGHAGKQGVRGAVPGLYLNPSMIEFIGYGEEIRTGPDAMQLFGGTQVQLPPGASATPVASGPMPGQIPAAAPAPQALPGQPPMPAAQPIGTQPVMQPGTVQPAHDFVQNATGGQMPGQPAAVPMQPQPGQPAPNVGVPGNAPLPGFPSQGGTGQ